MALTGSSRQAAVTGDALLLARIAQGVRLVGSSSKDAKEFDGLIARLKTPKAKKIARAIVKPSSRNNPTTRVASSFSAWVKASR